MLQTFSQDHRTYLFLQGPHGVFFRRLADRLVAMGRRVERINLNGGDRHDWGEGGWDYTGGFDGWPVFLDRFLQENSITDLVLYGDCRPLHHTAHGIARLRGCRIHVFEEGYVRPDYMTLERDGVNGNSTLPSDPQWYLAEAARLPPAPPVAPVEGSFDRRIRETMAYYFARETARLEFRRYASHRPDGPVSESIGWLWKWSMRGRSQRRSAQVLAEATQRPYFCLPLQLSSDAQIRWHSPFANMAVAIRYVVRSFAEYAPADTVLILKQHPLAADLVNYARITRREAARAGAIDRVFYVEDADVEHLVEKARGVVTVNSTTGTLALPAGTPTIVLGHAVYDIARITHQGSLDAFWQHPTPPDAAVYAAFTRVLLDRCLVHGGYLSEAGLDELVAGSVARFEAEDRPAMPGKPALLAGAIAANDTGPVSLAFGGS